MTYRPLVFVCTLLLLTSAGWGSASGGTRLERRLADCRSLRPSGSYEVGDATRVYISLPADIYPVQRLLEAPHGATFGWIANAVPRGRAGAALTANGCWSAFGQFDEISRCIKRTACGSTVAIRAKSAVRGIPDYEVTFLVIPY